MKVVLALGRDDAGDDAVGPLVAAALRNDPRVAADVVVQTCQEPLELLEAWAGASHAVVVDAAAAELPVGQVVVRKWGAVPAAANAGAGRHTLGLGTVLHLADALGRCPPRVDVVAVVAGETRPGSAPQAAVVAAVPVAAEAVLALLSGPAAP